MKLDVYGRFQLDIAWENFQWIVREIRDGKRLLVADAIIPAHFGETEIIAYIDDLHHEGARPGLSVRRIN